MPRDNKRIPIPDNCVSINTFIQPKKQRIVTKGNRLDGRAVSELRHIDIEVGTTPAVSGSAYLECGKTKILCSVNGPRDVLKKADFSNTGQLSCEFKYALFSSIEKQSYLPTEEEIDISKKIQETLMSVVLLHKFPKARVDISILVLNNDGGAISSAITCAGAALSNAGIEMYDLPIGCSLVHWKDNCLIDPTLEEENYEVEGMEQIIFAMMPAYNKQVIFLECTGSSSNLLYSKGVKDLEGACQQRLEDVRCNLEQHVSKIDIDDQIGHKSGSAELKLFQPQKYIDVFLKNSIRPDERELTSFREVSITTGCIENAIGSAFVRMGETRIICGLKTELTNPLPDEPKKGFLIPNVTLSYVCSGQYLPGPPAEEAQIYSQMIADLWKSSSFVLPEDLCIVEGKLCWCVFVEMTCLNHSGNVLDACVLAMMAAIKNAKFPKVIIDESNSGISVSDETENIQLNCIPLSFTFALFENDIVPDPTSEEESLAEGLYTVFLKEDGTIYGCFGTLSKQKFDFVKHSRIRCKELKALLDKI